MSTYTYDGDKISTAALFASLGYDRDAQQIKSGKFYSYINDLFGAYGGMAK